ncbi:hypothetical protein JCM1841_005191 [Sporobolomyces salmonicolor]
MPTLATFRPALQLLLALLSLVLYGVSCAGLATEKLKGDSATALVAFVAGVTVILVPGTMVCAKAKPQHFIATVWYDLASGSVLFVFLVAGLATLTYDTTYQRQVCSNPPRFSTGYDLGLVCTLVTTILAVGWICFALIVILGLVTATLAMRGWWMGDPKTAWSTVDELWSKGWNGSWSKRQTGEKPFAMTPAFLSLAPRRPCRTVEKVETETHALDQADLRQYLPFHFSLFVSATSLGGVASLIEQRLVSKPGADPRLVRISVGLEDFENLKADLIARLEKVIQYSNSVVLDSAYSVSIIQQPQRARAAGYGDKDRRPITPPLILKLECTDRRTRQPIPVDDVDTTFLVLAADLRTPEHGDANTISPSSSSLAISDHSSRSHSRTPTPSADLTSQHTQSRGSSPASRRTPAESHYITRTAVSTMAASPTQPPVPLPCGLTGPVEFSDSRSPMTSPTLSPNRPLSPVQSSSTHAVPGPSLKRPRRDSYDPSTGAAPSALIAYARNTLSPPSAGEEAEHGAIPNLIGTLHTNAYKLKDLQGEKGIFFVLPDLSVRTEGSFVLRLRLLSIGRAGTRTTGGTAVVASLHSNEFQVRSAKKFEGMLDPTPLSQCFAKQGVRIPTRKAAKSSAREAPAAADKKNKGKAKGRPRTAARTGA